MNAARRKKIPIIISDATKKAPTAIKSETVRKPFRRATTAMVII